MFWVYKIDGQILPRGHALSQFAKFAKETGRVGVTFASDAGVTGVNPTTYSQTNTGPKILAFVTLNDDFYAKPVETRHPRWRGVGADALGTLTAADITAISLVMLTPTDTSGGSGTDMQTVKIQLPAGFNIRSTTAMRSTSASGGEPVYEEVIVGTDKNSAYVTLPVGNILSVRFSK